jgi:hypothetical protein
LPFATKNSSKTINHEVEKENSSNYTPTDGINAKRHTNYKVTKVDMEETICIIFDLFKNYCSWQ